MAARTGMSNLITRWRRMVNDDSSTVWDDDTAQQILDDHRFDFYQEPLTIIPQQITGTTEYRVYQSKHKDLEETGSGTEVWRFYTSVGTSVTATHTIDYVNGKVQFSSDQQAAVYYLDGRSYDLHGAAADAWRERGADVAGYYSFGADGGSWKRSDWFEHCERMAQRHDALSWPITIEALRHDVKS